MERVIIAPDLRLSAHLHDSNFVLLRFFFSIVLRYGIMISIPHQLTSLNAPLARWIACVAMTCALLTSCGGADSSGVRTEGAVASVQISQSAATLAVGSTAALQLVVRDAAGQVLNNRNVVWTSSDNAIATVSALGLVTGITTGTVQIAGTVDGRSAVANLTITARAVASVQVAPSAPTLLVGESIQLSAQPLDAGGAPLSGRIVEWSSGNDQIVLVDATGRITGVAEGVTTVTARSETRTISIGVSVVAVPVARLDISPSSDTIFVGQATQFVAVPRDSTGSVLANRTTSWGTSNVDVLTISSSGRAVGVSPGLATVTASNSGRTAEAMVLVRLRPVASVTVTPSQATLTIGQTIQLSAVARDSNGESLFGRSMSFQSENQTIATVSSSGVLTARAEGTTRVLVTSEGQVGIATINVTKIPIASLRIDPDSLGLLIGGTQTLEAVTQDANGSPLTGRAIAWTSSAPAVATVSQSGVLNALSVGTAVITATAEGITATSRVTVRSVPVASVIVSPSTGTVIIGDDLDLTAEVRNASGAIVSSASVVWTSSDNRVAVVSSSGRVRGLAFGTAQISATNNGVVGTSSILVIREPVLSLTVAPTAITLFPGMSATIVATPKGRGGATLTDRLITFSSSNLAVATVTPTGVVTAQGVGVANIIATSEGKQAVVSVRVDPAPVASVQVTLANSNITVGSTTQATAVLKDANGNVLTGRTVVWSSSDATIASVSSSGTVTGVGVGTANIIATSEGKSGMVAVVVARAPVATISVSLANSSLTVGGTTQASAILRDAAGNILTGRSIVWSSSSASVASVNSNGVVTAAAAGTANIIATSEGKTGSATISVVQVPVATVAISLSSSNVIAGATPQATAVLRDASGAILTGRSVAWSTSNSEVATISSTGLVTTKSPGNVTITATSEGKSGSASLTVNPVPAATVTVTLAVSSITLGQSTTATAVVRDASGNVLTGRSVSWSTSNGSVASVSSIGGVSATGVGTATITATVEGKSGSAALMVTPIPPAPVATLALTVPTNSVTVGGTIQAAVILRDASGNPLSGRIIAWTSSSSSVAVVSSSGLITANGAGSATITAMSEGKSGSVVITVTPAPVATVAVTLGSSSVVVGQSTNASVVLKDASGNVLTGRTITFSTSSASVATVNSNGVVVAAGVGSAIVTATSEGKSGTASITVTPVPPAPVATVTVTVPINSVVVGGTIQASTVLRDASGSTLTGRSVNWSTSNASVIVVSTSGLITAAGVGTATVTATSEGKSGTASITVTPAPVATVSLSLDKSSAVVGSTVQGSATLRSSTGTLLTGRSITWTTSNSTVASVSSSGLVTAKSVGTATITATSETKSGTASFAVTAPPVVPVANVNVSLTPSVILQGTTSQAAAVLRDANGNQLSGRTVVWSSSTANATVNSNGVVTGVSAGTAVISATSEGKVGSATITVQLPAVARITVSPASATIKEKGNAQQRTKQLVATLYDANNRIITGRTIEWSSDKNSVATVNSNGLVTGEKKGSAVITARVDNTVGTADIDVEK